MSDEGHHEPIAIKVTDATRDVHRAIVLLTQELEEVDRYDHVHGAACSLTGPQVWE